MQNFQRPAHMCQVKVCAYRCTDRLHLLQGDAVQPSGRPENIWASTDGIISHRVADLDAEIARLTGLRDLLSAAIAPAAAPAPARPAPEDRVQTARPGKGIGVP
jgi:hypothetical protein